MDGPGTFTAEYHRTKYHRKITEIPTQILEGFTATEFSEIFQGL
jgi:hypothetical protein